MKLLTFQPSKVIDVLNSGKAFKSNCAEEYSDVSSENKALQEVIRFSPIWCIPIYNDVDTLYNLYRVSPSFPQCGILFEKEFKDVAVVDYVEYSSCVRTSRLITDYKISFNDCIIDDLTEEKFRQLAPYYECIVSDIQPDQVITRVEISTSTDPDVLASGLLDFIESSKCKEMLGMNYTSTIQNIEDDTTLTAWRSLIWHKLVDLSLMTKDTTRHSIEQFKKYCISIN